jgi:hypothetical protein
MKAGAEGAEEAAEKGGGACRTFAEVWGDRIRWRERIEENRKKKRKKRVS